MSIGGAFVLDSEWYWRIFEGEAMFDGEDAGATAARDFLRPLAWIAKTHVAIDDIVVDDSGEGVQLRINEQPVAIRCRGLRIERFVDAINRALTAAEVDFVFAIVESRRYELRGVLVTRDELAERRFARGTLPPIG